MRLLRLFSAVVLVGVVATFLLISLHLVAPSSACVQFLPNRACQFLSYFDSSIWHNTASRQFFNAHAGNNTLPNKIHLVWLASPLKAHALVLIDSIERHMPGTLVKLHVPIPQDATADWVRELRLRFERQLAPWMSPDGRSQSLIRLELVFHDDVPSELVGTPLQNSDIEQHHVGGLVSLLGQKGSEKRGGTPMGTSDNGVAHASDLLRILILWHEGGIYMDTDFLVLRDWRPIVEAYYPLILAEGALDVAKLKIRNLAACNGILIFPPHHLFIWNVMQDMQLVFQRLTIQTLFPHDTEHQSSGGWSAIGPDAITDVWLSWRLTPLLGSRFLPSSPEMEELSDSPAAVLKLEVPRPNLRKPVDISTTVTFVGRRWFMPTTFKSLTFRKTIEQIDELIKAGDTEFLQQPLLEDHDRLIKDGSEHWFNLTYDHAYSLHLWEGAASSSSARFLEIVSQTPLTTLGVLFAERICRRLCDVQMVTDLVDRFRPFWPTSMRRQAADGERQAVLK